MKRIVGLLIVLALFAVGSISAQPRGKRQKHDGMQIRMILQMDDKLELTDQQEAKLEQMAVDFKVARIDIDAEVEKASVVLKSMMKDDDASDSDVYRQIDKVADLKAQSQKMMFDHRNAVRGILTEAQLDKLEDLREQGRERWMQGRKGGNRGQCDGHGPKGFGKGNCDGQGPHGARGFGQGQGPGMGHPGPRWMQDKDVDIEIEKKDVEPDDSSGN